MKRIVRISVALATVIFLIAMLCISVSAEADESRSEVGEENFDRLEDSIPDEMLDALPDVTFEGDEGFGEMVSLLSTPTGGASVLLDIIGVKLGEALKLLAVLMALIAISAVLNSISGVASSPTLSCALTFCSVGAVISAVVYTLYGQFSMVSEFFEKLGGMMSGIFPITTALWAMGGNVTTAGVGGATFGVMLHMCNWLWASGAIPVASAVTVLGFCDALCEEMNTARLMQTVKRIYNFILALSMTLLLFSLSAQTLISSSADSLSSRSARFVFSNVVPGIGGGVSETFRTVGSSVSYLKNIFGIGGIILILLLVLPVALSLLLTRFAFLISSGLASMLGCERESRLLANLGESFGSLLGVVAGASAVFIMSLCIFMQSVVAAV